MSNFLRSRKLGVLCGAALVACIGLTNSSVHAANILVDPGFELGTASGPENTGGWSMVNGAALNTLAANSHTGNNSVNLTNGGTGNASGVPLAFETTNIGVTAGAKYILTGFGITTGQMAPPGSSNNGTSFAGIQATFFSGDNAGGTNLGTVATGAGNAAFSNHIDATTPVNTWIPLSTGVFTAPAGAQSLQIFAIAIFPQELTPGGVFVDDMDLEQVPEPASLGLLGLASVTTLLRRRRRD